MSCRQVNYANLRKAELIEALGSQCWACGSIVPLHIDHPYGRDWQPRKVCFYSRVLRYWKEHLEGKVRLLCKTCNDSRRFNDVVLAHPHEQRLLAEPNDLNVPF